MNKIIKSLIETANSSDNLDRAGDALGDLGLLVERHIQNRYGEEDYFLLLGKNAEVYNLRLTEDDLKSIVNYFFFHIMNVDIYPVTAAWCLGKCYGINVLDGMMRLLRVFDSDDDVTLQLLYSINALYDLEDIKEVLLPRIEAIKAKENLPKANACVEELSEVFDFLRDST